MLKNYFKIAIRNLWKSKGYTAINVVGLSVAFTIAVFLLLTAYFLITFDSFHEDKDRIFQTYIFSNDPERVSKSGGMPIPLAPILKAEYPEIEGAARIFQGRKTLVEYNGKYFDENICMTDPDFLDIFSFPMIKGNTKTSLNDLDNIVVSEKMAKAVFGDEEPIGKQIQVGTGVNKKPYIVSGLISDNPNNSTIRYDALIRIENMPSYSQDKDNWSGFNHMVFIKLNLNEKQESFENRIRSFAPKYFPQNLNDLKNKGAKADARGDIMALRLQKLTNVHFDTEISGGKGTPIAVVYTLIGIAIFILFIACVNFINLNIARSFSRAKEVGVRKSLGALKNQLFFQIWGESIIICLIGFLVGVFLAFSLLPTFNAFFDAKIDLGFLIQPGFILVMIGVFIVVTFIAGGYPAIKMTSFNTIEVLKGKVTVKGRGGLRNSLIVSQFAMSTLLICCTVIAYQQINYLRTRPLGFEKEEVISIPVGTVVNGQQVLQRMRNKLANDPTIVSISGSGVNLGKGKDRVTARSVIGLKYKGRDVSTDWVSIDYDYLKTLGIKLLAGREFNPAYPSDSLDRVIITESMAKALGEKDPVGKAFRSEEDSNATAYQIIGLIPDFNLYSVANEKSPITMHLSHSETINYIFVRVTPQNHNISMEKMKAIWHEVAPQSEYLGSFLDDNVEAWFQNEKMLSSIFSLASSIAILLSCLGLFAIALLVVEQRTKEIGIRKVLGATIPNILLILSKDFIKLIVIALLIASPLAWFGMQKWLDGYAEKVQISIWVFVIVGLVSLSIALLSISFQAIKAALMNPVKSLKTE